MQVYLDALKHILEHGVDRPDRTGTGTRSVFGMQMRYNLQEGFPAMTTKKLAFKAVKAELLWFLKGGTHDGRADDNELKKLTGAEKTIWTANAEADYWKPHAQFPGDLGRIYGVQWRSWFTKDGTTIDQLKTMVDRIQNDPYDRRMVVSAWNPGEISDMALPPCHIMFQFYVAEGRLSLQMYQRTCDMFLGVPFNIASYSLLLAMVAQVTGLEQGEFIHTLGDAHIYQNHMEQVKKQLTREPLQLPTLWLNPSIKDIDSFTIDDMKLENYESHPGIKAPMAV